MQAEHSSREREVQVRRFVLLSSVLAMFLGSMIGVASAAKPVREPVPSPSGVLGPEICGFEVAVDATVNRSEKKTFSDGHSRTTGTLTAKLTNLDTEQSIELNASGP